MGLLDWDFFRSTANYTEAIAPTLVIEGTGSLGLTFTATSGNQSWQAQLASGHPRGIARGKIRTQARLAGGMAAGAHRIGLFCLGSVEDLTSVGAVYTLTVGGGGANEVDFIELKKMDQSLHDSAPLTLFMSETITPALQFNEDFVMELEWDDDSDEELGGTHLIARFAPGTDFNNLVEWANVVDEAAPYALGAGFEGLCAHMNSGSFGSTWRFDHTELYNLA